MSDETDLLCLSSISNLDRSARSPAVSLVKLAVLLRRGPFAPAVFTVNDRGAVFTVKFGPVFAFGFKSV